MSHSCYNCNADVVDWIEITSDHYVCSYNCLDQFREKTCSNLFVVGSSGLSELQSPCDPSPETPRMCSRFPQSVLPLVQYHMIRRMLMPPFDENGLRNPHAFFWDLVDVVLPAFFVSVGYVSCYFLESARAAVREILTCPPFELNQKICSDFRHSTLFSTPRHNAFRF
ncbi:hypothetical protein GEMRC1_013390 [Eukaryota sp. GEM-RC1]